MAEILTWFSMMSLSTYSSPRNEFLLHFDITGRLSATPWLRTFWPRSAAINAVVYSHSAKLGDLDMMSDRDQSQIALWNNQQWTDLHVCVHDLISEQAIARPQAVAIDAWDGSFTYQELEFNQPALSRNC